MAADCPAEVEAAAAEAAGPVDLAEVCMAPDPDMEAAPDEAAEEAPVVMADDDEPVIDLELAAEGLGLEDPMMTPWEMTVLTA